MTRVRPPSPIENTKGIDLLVEHIVGHGHRRVGYVGGDPVSNRRWRADAMRF